MIYQFGGKLKRNKSGLTLIEMMTSTFIIVIITTIFIANYRTGNKRSDLTMTAQKLVSDIHTAQNNTLGLVKYGSSTPPAGWGVNFNKSTPNKYIVFADLDQPPSEGPPAQVAGPGYMKYDSATESDESLGARIVDLPKNIVINSLIVNNLTSVNNANVTFLPPDPRTNIFDETTNGTSSSLNITLTDSQDGSIKTIRVNFLGLVELIN